MLNLPFLKFLEFSEGKTLPSVLSEITGISERTLRKPEGVIRQKKIEEANLNSLKAIKKRLAGSGYSKNEIDTWIELHPGNSLPGAICSGVVYECQIEGFMEFPRTLEFARTIDELSTRLRNAQQNNNLTGFKEALLSSEFSTPIYFAQNSDEMKGDCIPPMLNHFHAANDWTEIDKPLQAIMANTLFSLLAHWDVEFSTQYFSSFEPRSCFAMVLPRLDPAVGNIEEGTIFKRRDMFWYPVRRLIDLMACMGEFVRNKQHWPERVPDVHQIARCFELNSDDDVVYERKLKKWRNGTNKFTRQEYALMWKALCPEINEKHAPEPRPIFVATGLWQAALVEVSATSKQKTILLFHDEYDFWWRKHRADLKAKGCVFGTIPWPACFNEI